MTVVIVEDEVRIREGIEILLKRMDADYQVVATAENGKIGLEKILQTTPDLIITDLKMPVMDGIEMLTALREAGLQTQAIVLSAYSEFAYAQKAMKLGVKDYLLKPIQRDSFVEALSRVRHQCLTQETTKTALAHSLPSILRQIIMSADSLSEEMEQVLLNRFGIHPSAPVAAVAFFPGVPYDQHRTTLARQIQELFSQWKDGRPILVTIPEKETMLCLILECSQIDALHRWVEVRLGLLRRSWQTPLAAFGWLVSPQLGALCSQFQSLLQWQDWNISKPDVLLIDPQQEEKTLLQIFPDTTAVEKQMQSAICNFDWNRAGQVYRQFAGILDGEQMYTAKSIKDAYVRILWNLLNTAKEVGIPGAASLSYRELLNRLLHSRSRLDLQSILEEVLQLLSEQQHGGEQTLSPLVCRAAMMIREQYSHGITLEELAARMRVTPEYLSTQFHREMGMTFGAYIRDTRTEQAKKLLLGTEKKLYEIAREVGYSDPKYFSRVFREQTGYLPADYRKMHK